MSEYSVRPWGSAGPDFFPHPLRDGSCRSRGAFTRWTLVMLAVGARHCLLTEVHLGQHRAEGLRRDCGLREETHHWHITQRCPPNLPHTLLSRLSSRKHSRNCVWSAVPPHRCA
eukprot:1585871-Rhodomonas_salina.1